MRLWHLVFAVFVASLGLTLARDPVGRFSLVVFVTTLGVIVLGASSMMMLFRTFGAIGMARTRGAYAEAVAATVGVLVLGAGSMLLVFSGGIAVMIWLIG